MKMELQKLRDAHEKVKNHPFRLNHSDWKGYYKLLNEMDKEFTEQLEIKFNKDYKIEFGFFIHEFRSAIWHLKFEFNMNTKNDKGDVGRFGCTSDSNDDKAGRIYGKIIPEYQKKIVIILENYIQQIHHFITTGGEFEEFITYYMGCDNAYDETAQGGRWNKYKLDKEKGAFKCIGKLK